MLTRSICARILTVVCGLAIPACSSTSFATIYYWDGNNGSLWSSTGPTNWSLSPDYINDPVTALPGSGDDVYFIFNPAYNLSNSLGRDFSVKGITFTNDATSPVAIGGVNTLTLGSDGLTVLNASAAQTISANVAVGSGQTWTNSSTNVFTVSGILSGNANVNLGGTGLTSGAATGGFVLSNANNTFSGQVTLANAQSSLTLNGNGSLAGVGNASAGISLNGGSSLILDNSVTNSSSRLAGTMGITSNGGTILMLGSGSAATSQAFGALTLGSGATNVNVTPGSGQTATLSVGSIVRSNGGTVNFSTPNTINLSIPNTPTGMTVGAIGPWASVGNETAANETSNPLDFAVVSAGQVVALPSSSYNTGAFGTWGATDNVMVNNTQTMNASKTVGTLYLTGAAIVNTANSNTLTIGGGGIIANNGSLGLTLGGSNGTAYNNITVLGGTALNSPNFNGVIRAGTGVPDLVANVSGVLASSYSNVFGELQINSGITNAPNPTGTFTAQTVNGSNVVTLTAGNTTQLCPGTTLTGLGAIGLSGTQTITGIVDATHFTVGSNATSGPSRAVSRSHGRLDRMTSSNGTAARNAATTGAHCAKWPNPWPVIASSRRMPVRRA